MTSLRVDHTLVSAEVAVTEAITGFGPEHGHGSPDQNDGIRGMACVNGWHHGRPPEALRQLRPPP
jgi:hypothetical protein